MMSFPVLCVCKLYQKKTTGKIFNVPIYPMSQCIIILCLEIQIFLLLFYIGFHNMVAATLMSSPLCCESYSVFNSRKSSPTIHTSTLSAAISRHYCNSDTWLIQLWSCRHPPPSPASIPRCHSCLNSPPPPRLDSLLPFPACIPCLTIPCRHPHRFILR